MRARHFAIFYGALLLLRLGAALFSPAYIHPDEYFQNGEVLVGELFDKKNVFKTWEFDSAYPCRSMASIRLFGLPLVLLAKLSSRWKMDSPSAKLLIRTQRATFFVLSLLLDWSVSQLLANEKGEVRQAALLRLATMASILTFGVRPFSNNVEACMLALALVFTLQCTSNSRNQASRARLAALLGAVLSAGFLSRFTMAIFALCPGVYFLRKASLTEVGVASAAFVAVAAAHIDFDTAFFAKRSDSNGGVLSLSDVVIAPFNAALYNSKSGNLENYGIHPRWLHLLVNAPMILGIEPYLLLCKSTWDLLRDKLTSNDKIAQCSRLSTSRMLCLATIAIGLGGLSVQPHQEPRFLLPLIVPASVVVALRPRSQRCRATRILNLINIIQTVLLLGLFGIGHQGGTIQAVETMEQRLCSGKLGKSKRELQFSFWRSFMPPRHLLLPAAGTPCAQLNVSVQDNGGVSAKEMVLELASVLDSNARCLFFAPVWAVADPDFRYELGESSIRLAPYDRFFPHIDTDHLGESWQLYASGQFSLVEAFSLGVWRVEAERQQASNDGMGRLSSIVQ